MISVDGTLTAYENLMLMARLYDIPRAERKERVREMLSFLELEQHTNSLVRTFSGGMIRKMEVGQAMLHHPKVLLLDEPTTGLDPVARQSVWEHLFELRDRFDTTIFFSTHNMEEADEVSDRVAVMNRGKIEAIGRVEELKAKTGKPDATLEDAFIFLHRKQTGGNRQFSRNPQGQKNPAEAWIKNHNVMIHYLSQTIKKSYVLAEMETRKLLHDPTELISRAVQPILWLGIFGEALSKVRAIPTPGLTYLQFIVPGILTQSVVFVAIFYGLYVIMDRDTGILQKLLVTPTPRLALVWGKMISAGIRGLSQALIVFLFAVILGIQLHMTVWSIIGVIVIVMLGASFFTGLSMIIASIVKTRERFMGIGQVITLPLFFASNAIYPIAIMPGWLQAVANVNPLSYMVDGLRALMLSGGAAVVGFDIGVLAAVTLFISVLSAWFYPKVVI